MSTFNLLFHHFLKCLHLIFFLIPAFHNHCTHFVITSRKLLHKSVDSIICFQRLKSQIKTSKAHWSHQRLQDIPESSIRVSASRPFFFCGFGWGEQKIREEELRLLRNSRSIAQIAIITATGSRAPAATHSIKGDSGED